MNLLVIGSGAREHALAVFAARCSPMSTVYVWPGNAGTRNAFATLPIPSSASPAEIVASAMALAIEFVLVGPEAPLVAGVADALRSAGVSVFGPGSEGARLESSKVFAKHFLQRHQIPTAPFATFHDRDAAIAYVESHGAPIVIKADGLAAGKGVYVAHTLEQAREAIDDLMVKGVAGVSGHTVVIEQCLNGAELSVHVLTDGVHFVTLGIAQDHKRLRDRDQGPNTGGMGAYSPVPVVTEALLSKLHATIIEPTIRGLAQDKIAFRGVLFIGVMMNDDHPHVLEFNVRFGDPEAAVLLARCPSDTLAVLRSVADGSLPSTTSLELLPDAVVGVVLASAGYPARTSPPEVIHGLLEAEQIPGVEVFHAATKSVGNDVVTNGGRVLLVCARGGSIDEASERAYAAVDRVHFAGKQFRRDIGWQARSPVK